MLEQMMTTTEAAGFRDVLVAEAAKVEVALPGAVIDGCVTHYGLMVRWNATHNLTRVVDPTEAAVRHYLDCVVPLLSWPAPMDFLDIGSGAGFPGLMASLAWSGSVGTLVEPARKRASFLNIAATAMGVKAFVRSPGSMTSKVVLSRATFSDGVRETLWPYVEAGGVLLVWSTVQELPTWERTVSTWEDASFSHRDYRLPGLDGRVLAVVERG